ncbi:hypothetical protein BESB_059050 [Besnoitia besnoiti]|uniref:AP2 domain transcription factor AP2X-1 n=1 Tax=Besnoitia besnoiti TaxID=94643 RepID=A0A2A9M956_BESBE|nr:hypothetical protein BESB_059050 [Besnoitia besnoiti]PFH35018.1 hypothetical protein BESB_059050 [Besnoitia besnoiti]
MFGELAVGGRGQLELEDTDRSRAFLKGTRRASVGPPSSPVAAPHDACASSSSLSSPSSSPSLKPACLEEGTLAAAPAGLELGETTPAPSPPSAEAPGVGSAGRARSCRSGGRTSRVKKGGSRGSGASGLSPAPSAAFVSPNGLSVDDGASPETLPPEAFPPRSVSPSSVSLPVPPPRPPNGAAATAGAGPHGDAAGSPGSTPQASAQGAAAGPLDGPVEAAGFAAFAAFVSPTQQELRSPGRSLQISVKEQDSTLGAQAAASDSHRPFSSSPSDMRAPRWSEEACGVAETGPAPGNAEGSEGAQPANATGTGLQAAVGSEEVCSLFSTFGTPPRAREREEEGMPPETVSQRAAADVAPQRLEALPGDARSPLSSFPTFSLGQQTPPARTRGARELALLKQKEETSLSPVGSASSSNPKKPSDGVQWRDSALISDRHLIAATPSPAGSMRSLASSPLSPPLAAADVRDEKRDTPLLACSPASPLAAHPAQGAARKPAGIASTSEAPAGLSQAPSAAAVAATVPASPIKREEPAAQQPAVAGLRRSLRNRQPTRPEAAPAPPPAGPSGSSVSSRSTSPPRGGASPPGVAAAPAAAKGAGPAPPAGSPKQHAKVAGGAAGPASGSVSPFGLGTAKTGANASAPAPAPPPASSLVAGAAAGGASGGKKKAGQPQNAAAKGKAAGAPLVISEYWSGLTFDEMERGEVAWTHAAAGLPLPSCSPLRSAPGTLLSSGGGGSAAAGLRAGEDDRGCSAGTLDTGGGKEKAAGTGAGVRAGQACGPSRHGAAAWLGSNSDPVAAVCWGGAGVDSHVLPQQASDREGRSAGGSKGKSAQQPLAGSGAAGAAGRGDTLASAPGSQTKKQKGSRAEGLEPALARSKSKGSGCLPGGAGGACGGGTHSLMPGARGAWEDGERGAGGGRRDRDEGDSTRFDVSWFLCDESPRLPAFPEGRRKRRERTWESLWLRPCSPVRELSPASSPSNDGLGDRRYIPPRPAARREDASSAKRRRAGGEGGSWGDVATDRLTEEDSDAEEDSLSDDDLEGFLSDADAASFAYNARRCADRSLTQVPRCCYCLLPRRLPPRRGRSSDFGGDAAGAKGPFLLRLYCSCTTRPFGENVLQGAAGRPGLLLPSARAAASPLCYTVRKVALDGAALEAAEEEEEGDDADASACGTSASCLATSPPSSSRSLAKAKALAPGAGDSLAPSPATTQAGFASSSSSEGESGGGSLASSRFSASLCSATGAARGDGERPQAAGRAAEVTYRWRDPCTLQTFSSSLSRLQGSLTATAAVAAAAARADRPVAFLPRLYWDGEAACYVASCLQWGEEEDEAERGAAARADAAAEDAGPLGERRDAETGKRSRPEKPGAEEKEAALPAPRRRRCLKLLQKKFSVAFLGDAKAHFYAAEWLRWQHRRQRDIMEEERNREERDRQALALSPLLSGLGGRKGSGQGGGSAGGGGGGAKKTSCLATAQMALASGRALTPEEEEEVRRQLENKERQKKQKLLRQQWRRQQAREAKLQLQRQKEEAAASAAAAAAAAAAGGGAASAPQSPQKHGAFPQPSRAEKSGQPVAAAFGSSPAKPAAGGEAVGGSGAGEGVGTRRSAAAAAAPPAAWGSEKGPSAAKKGDVVGRDSAAAGTSAAGGDAPPCKAAMQRRAAAGGGVPRSGGVLPVLRSASPSSAPAPQQLSPSVGTPAATARPARTVSGARTAAAPKRGVAAGMQPFAPEGLPQPAAAEAEADNSLATRAMPVEAELSPSPRDGNREARQEGEEEAACLGSTSPQGVVEHPAAAVSEMKAAAYEEGEAEAARSPGGGGNYAFAPSTPPPVSVSGLPPSEAVPESKEGGGVLATVSPVTGAESQGSLLLPLDSAAGSARRLRSARLAAAAASGGVVPPGAAPCAATAAVAVAASPKPRAAAAPAAPTARPTGGAKAAGAETGGGARGAASAAGTPERGKRASAPERKPGKGEDRAAA